MNLQQIVMILIILVFIVAWYSATDKLRKIYCVYNRVDKTTTEKWCKRNSRWVNFENGKYYVIPDRISLMDWKRGIHQLLPIKVQRLEWSWYSDIPHDPNDYENVWASPELRNAINEEEHFRSYAKGVASQTGGKKAGFLEKYGMIISLGGLLLVFAFVYMQGQAANNRMDIIESMLRGGK